MVLSSLASTSNGLDSSISSVTVDVGVSTPVLATCISHVHQDVCVLSQRNRKRQHTAKDVGVGVAVAAVTAVDHDNDHLLPSESNVANVSDSDSSSRMKPAISSNRKVGEDVDHGTVGTASARHFSTLLAVTTCKPPFGGREGGDIGIEWSSHIEFGGNCPPVADVAVNRDCNYNGNRDENCDRNNVDLNVFFGWLQHVGIGGPCCGGKRALSTRTEMSWIPQQVAPLNNPTKRHSKPWFRLGKKEMLIVFGICIELSVISIYRLHTTPKYVNELAISNKAVVPYLEDKHDNEELRQSEDLLMERLRLRLHREMEEQEQDNKYLNNVTTSTIVTPRVLPGKQQERHKETEELPLPQQNVNSSLAILISSYKQPTCLNRLLRHYQSCHVVHSISVNFFHDNHTLPLQFEELSSYQKPVTVAKVPNTLNHRFTPRPIATTAVFHTDVDWIYSCDALTYALSVYRREQQRVYYNQHQQTHQNISISNSTYRYSSSISMDVDTIVVGFHPRQIYPKIKLPSPQTPFYRWEESYTAPHVFNTVFITMGAITHPRVLEWYFQPHYQALRDIVTHYKTAEDLLASFILAQKQAQVVAICPKPGHACEASCAEHDVPTLSGSTSLWRTKIIHGFWQHFGKQVLPQQQPQKGNNAYVYYWQGESEPHFHHHEQQQSLDSDQDTCLPRKCHDRGGTVLEFKIL